jgi:hypothetical protein
MEQSYLNDFEIHIMDCEEIDERYEEAITADISPILNVYYTIQVTYKHSAIPMYIRYKVYVFDRDRVIDTKLILDYICEKVRYFTQGTWTHQIDITGKSYFNRELKLHAIDVDVYHTWKKQVDDFKTMLGDEHFKAFVNMACP